MIDYKAVQDALGGIKYRAAGDLAAPPIQGQAVAPPPEPVERGGRIGNQRPADEQPGGTQPETSQEGDQGSGDDSKKG
jgi:hypothetical protein